MKKELEKILQDPEFVKKIILKKTREEAKKSIEEKGISVTKEEMDELHGLYSAVYEECEEMSKEDLLKISGGWGQKDPVEKLTGGVFNKEDLRKAISWFAENVLKKSFKEKAAKDAVTPSDQKSKDTQTSVSPEVKNFPGRSKDEKINDLIFLAGAVTAGLIVYKHKDKLQGTLQSWVAN